ncbi:glucose-6-phosphate dehydrogenase [Candidatus Kaiserbacteria bacterium]|nr:glucose-6-phosphate dehydrogenase [Candidatus Kaiserbacteria bacterium]
MSESWLQKYNHPTSIVIFGGTGNLAETKLLPALLALYIKNVLPDSFRVIGLSRKKLSNEDYRSYVRQVVAGGNHSKSESVIEDFCRRFYYVAGDFDDNQSYENVIKELKDFDDELGQCTSKLFYLAVPPVFYKTIFKKLKTHEALNLCDEIGSWSRLLVEKPFGNDLATAKELEKQLCDSFNDDQIYRIDHYLAKDAIENIISLRFANSILADSWNGRQIESITIKLFETKDVSTRGSFYDGIGALRDVGQNHLLQILALLTMLPSNVHDASEIRQARAKALGSLSKKVSNNVIRGQYAGYQDELGVEKDSVTETYFQITTEMESENWRGVPIVLESGKALSESKTEALIVFKGLDKCSCDAESENHYHKNTLRLTFSPEQMIKLKMWFKKPGFDFTLEARDFTLSKSEAVDTYSPEAYEKVLFDCIAGNQTRFVSGEEVVAAWEFIGPILDNFDKNTLHIYEKGSTGPSSL